MKKKTTIFSVFSVVMMVKEKIFLHNIFRNQTKVGLVAPKVFGGWGIFGLRFSLFHNFSIKTFFKFISDKFSVYMTLFFYKATFPPPGNLTTFFVNLLFLTLGGKIWGGGGNPQKMLLYKKKSVILKKKKHLFFISF